MLYAFICVLFIMYIMHNWKHLLLSFGNGGLENLGQLTHQVQLAKLHYNIGRGGMVGRYQDPNKGLGSRNNKNHGEVYLVFEEHLPP